MAAGLGLFSYYVRELLASLAVFTVPFLFLTLIVMSAVLLWSASVQLPVWWRPESRNLAAFSRRLIVAYARS